MIAQVFVPVAVHPSHAGRPNRHKLLVFACHILARHPHHRQRDNRVFWRFQRRIPFYSCIYLFFFSALVFYPRMAWNSLFSRGMTANQLCSSTQRLSSLGAAPLERCGLRPTWSANYRKPRPYRQISKSQSVSTPIVTTLDSIKPTQVQSWTRTSR